MKLKEFDLDKKLSIAEMKQVKAGSITTNSNGVIIVTDDGEDSDGAGGPVDRGH